MARASTFYTPEDCSPAYQLNWSLAIFWNATPIPPDHWLDDLRDLTEKDDVRILGHRITEKQASQFFVSTTPNVAPCDVARSIKGRLQHQIRDERHRAFRGNYSIKSVGETSLSELQGYLDLQLDRHQMSDLKVQSRLKKFQIDDSEIDLSQPRTSSNAQHMFNLHIVMVHDGRWDEIRESKLAASRNMILKTAAKKGHLLVKARILTDHIHVMIGCNVTENPMDVVLAYMNNIAFSHDESAIFQNGYFVGTFGEYDRGAIRQAL